MRRWSHVLILLLFALVQIGPITAGPNDKVPVCTENGLIWVALNDAPELPTAPIKYSQCHFCLVAAASGSAHTPPVTAPLPVAYTSHIVYHRSVQTAVRPYVHLAFEARGPPLVIA